MTFILHNNNFLKDEAVLTVRDRGLRGDGVFDTMLCVDGAPVYANDHFTRLINHAKILNLPIDKSVEEFKNDANRILKKNNFGSVLACLTTTITRGPAIRGLQTPQNPETQIIMRAAAIPPMDGIPVHAITAQTVRKNEGSPLSRIKSLNYGDPILAKQEAERAGATDAIILNNAGHATCFTIGNLFIFKGGQLYTPPLSDGCMNGVIRGKIMLRYTAIEQSLTAQDIEQADAIYLTNSLRGVVSIASLNGKTMPKCDFPIDHQMHLG